jgi:methylmalonyl-CoA/ethylmalonyl-CoA epimerase
MVIDHICFAVRNLEEGIAYWQNIFGYGQKTEIVVNSLQKVKVTFMWKENSIDIKLIEPLETNASLLKFVNRGGGFHHLCFKCSDMDTTISELRDKGLIMLVPPQPGEAFNNKNIAFLFARYGLNLELIDTDERAGLLQG